MLDTIEALRQLLDDIDERQTIAEKYVEQIRRHYKYQTEHTDSLSEDLIVTFENVDMRDLTVILDELEEYEND